jgi:hypothetical protein
MKTKGLNMAYYFSYDVSIPEYIQEKDYYTNEELHCTLAYSQKDISKVQLEHINLIKIPINENATITKVDIFNSHIVLLIDNPNLMKINKNLLEQFSIVEEHQERKMHVSIRKGLGQEPINLKALEDKYIGKKILLHRPKLFIKDTITKEKTVISLDTIENKKLKPKI